MLFILFLIIIFHHLFCFILKGKIKTLRLEEKYEKKIEKKNRMKEKVKKNKK